MGGSRIFPISLCIERSIVPLLVNNLGRAILSRNQRSEKSRRCIIIIIIIYTTHIIQSKCEDQHLHLVSEPSCTNNCTNKQTLKTHYSAAPAKPLLFCYLHFFFIRTIQELCSVTALYKTCGSTKTEEDWSVGRPVAQCCFYDSSPSLISYQLASCRTSAP